MIKECLKRKNRQTFLNVWFLLSEEEGKMGWHSNFYNNKKGDGVFSMSGAVLKRIDILLTAAAREANNRRLHNWFDILLTLARQIEYDMNDDELKKNEELLEKLKNLDKQYMNYETKGKIGGFKDYGKFYDALNGYETFLRKCFNKRDMLMAAKPAVYSEEGEVIDVDDTSTGED